MLTHACMQQSISRTYMRWIHLMYPCMYATIHLMYLYAHPCMHTSIHLIAIKYVTIFYARHKKSWKPPITHHAYLDFAFKLTTLKAICQCISRPQGTHISTRPLVYNRRPTIAPCSPRTYMVTNGNTSNMRQYQCPIALLHQPDSGPHTSSRLRSRSSVLYLCRPSPTGIVSLSVWRPRNEKTGRWMTSHTRL